MGYPTDDRVLSALKWQHQFYLLLDLTGVYAVVATILFLLGAWLIYRSICSKSKKTYRKISIFLFGILLVYFAAFETRMVKMRCQRCNIHYSYREARVFGILLNTYHYQTHYTPESIIEYKAESGATCPHYYVVDDSWKFWGGLIPTLEYELGMDVLGLPGASKEPIVIDDSYAMPKLDHMQSNEP